MFIRYNKTKWFIFIIQRVNNNLDNKLVTILLKEDEEDMSKPCTYCGIPISIPETGYLYIQKSSSVTSNVIYVCNQLDLKYINNNDNMIQVEYKDHTTLKNFSNNILPLINRNNIHAGFHERSDAFSHFRLMPLSVLSARIQHEDIVDFIISGSLQSYLQPIINIKDNTIYGYESLLRSADVTRQINPGLIFDIANKTGLHSLLDKRARSQAIETRKQYVKEGVKSFINFLPSTIYNPKFCLQHTFELVEKYKLKPEDLVFEVVETEKIDDINHLKTIFQEYKASGMKVALDDVGSGYATLETFKLLQPDYVKIDRNYISYCDQSKEKQSFLIDVMNISQNLGIKVLGEGIERKEELEFCKSIGVDLAQGYLIGKPSPTPLGTNTINI